MSPPAVTNISDHVEETTLNVGNYHRPFASNLDNTTSKREQGQARSFFDRGLAHLFGFFHEEASHCFLECIKLAPDCVLAHVLLALCHCPNYNFKGEAYYAATNPADDTDDKDEHSDFCPNFPSQTCADFHAREALGKIKRMKEAHDRRVSPEETEPRPIALSDSPLLKEHYCCNSETHPTISNEIKKNSSLPTEKECEFVYAVHALTCKPGIDPSVAEKTVGRPYANAMRKIYKKYGREDPDIAYFFAESLMVLNAWSLYQYPSGKTLSPDVDEVRSVIEDSLRRFPEHGGLCHLYVHLCEMSPAPQDALTACTVLREKFPDSGHLIHMPTHIDVLVGDYDSCVRYNIKAIDADLKAMRLCPNTAGTLNFYFGYITHNFHMAVYGAILGGMEAIAMKKANELSELLSEDLLTQNPELTSFLESYSAMDVHIMVRFGRWKEILELDIPVDEEIMFYRIATTHFARAIAYAVLGDVESAKHEADIFEDLAMDPLATERILHNNLISSILAVDIPMVRGEIAYREGNYEEAFALLRESVELQDQLNYDEPWGKMQPVRHALGGLLLEQNHIDEAIEVFRVDLKYHPNNPWALIGLMKCLKKKHDMETKTNTDTTMGCCSSKSIDKNEEQKDPLLREIQQLRSAFEKQRASEYADFDVSASCLCCTNTLAQNKNP